MVDHEELIENLSSGVPAVSRPLPVVTRALVWGGVALALGLAATRLIPTAHLDVSAPGAWLFLANAGLSLALGALLLAAAFRTTIPGQRSSGWPWILGLAGLWLAASVGSIAGVRHPVGQLGEGQYCFRFVMLAGLPMMVVTLFALRRTGALRPVRTLAIAGAAIGFLAFGLLAFCHPAGMDVVDFTMHVLAALAVGLITVVIGRRLIAA